MSPASSYRSIRNPCLVQICFCSTRCARRWFTVLDKCDSLTWKLCCVRTRTQERTASLQATRGEFLHFLYSVFAILVDERETACFVSSPLPYHSSTLFAPCTTGSLPTLISMAAFTPKLPNRTWTHLVLSLFDALSLSVCGGVRKSIVDGLINVFNNWLAGFTTSNLEGL